MLSTISLVSLLALGTTAVHAESTVTAAPSPSQVLKARAEGSTPSALTAYSYAFSEVPYQVNPYEYLRGPQSGYNICNSTTETVDSQCQTLRMNSIEEFCLWGAPGISPNETIGDIEAAVVSYCSRAGLGGRIMPEGTFTGLQWMKTSAYVQLTGVFNQSALNLDPTDTGGELDPHGADQLGNPLGGLVYSNGLPTGDNSTLQQVVSWNNFVGSGSFCFKLCDPTVSSPNYCENKFDLLGCDYNAPAAYEDGVFLSCEGELQDVVGTYTVDGVTSTYSQPSSLAADTTLPWTPRIPSSSNCVTYQSSDLFPVASLGYQASGAAATASSTGSASGAVSTGSTGASAAASSRSGGSSGSPTNTGSASSNAASSIPTSGASSIVAKGSFLAVGASALVMMLM